jgi:hypothetical protein
MRRAQKISVQQMSANLTDDEKVQQTVKPKLWQRIYEIVAEIGI